MTIIEAEWSMALLAFLFVIASFGMWSENTAVGRNMSGIIVALVTAMFLANVGIIPNTAPVYDTIGSYIVPIAMPMLLFKANLRRIIPEAKGMLIAFLLGVIGTVLGAILGVWLLPLGSLAPDLAGIFSATYIGGGINVAAVAKALEVDSSLLLASVAADNVVGVTYLAMLAALPAFSFARRWLPPSSEKIVDLESVIPIEKQNENHLDILHLCFAFGLSFTIVTIGYGMATFINLDNYGILFVTAISVALANIFPTQMGKLKGHFEIGMLMMYLFFAIIGASTDILRMIDSAMVIVIYTVIVVTTHAIVIFGGSRFFKLDLAEVIIASNACAAGPTTAAALAAGKKWHHLVTPGLMCGVLGYVLANFIGITLATILSM